MKVAFTADIHIGNHKRFGGPVQAGLNRRCRHHIDALNEAVLRVAGRGDCRDFVVLGDLFDTSHPEPQVIAAVQDCFRGRLDVGLMVGNHDQVTTTEGDHALGPLGRLPNVQVVERASVTSMPDASGELVVVPFVPGPAKEWLPKQLKELELEPADGARALAVHLGIITDDTPPFLRNAHDAVDAAWLSLLCRKHGIGYVFAGNWHDQKMLEVNGVRITQVGALVPTGWDNPGLDGYGAVVVWDTKAKDDYAVTQTLVPGPRFLTFPNLAQAIAGVTQAKPLGHKLYVRVKTPVEAFQEAADWFDAAREQGTIVDGELVLDDGGEALIAARTAATVARSATTLDEALAAFVKEMPVGQGIDRDAVLARAKGYLGRV